MMSEHEFLPAALEITESPPNPIARKMVLTLCVLTLVAIVWACFGKVDIVAVAPGKVVLSDRSKTIQVSELGIVRAIHVRDGSVVQAGDVLLELDSTNADADSTRWQSDQQSVSRELSRYRTFLAHINGKSSAHQSNAFDRDLSDSLFQDYQQKHDALEQALIAKRNDRDALVQNVKRMEQTLPLITQRSNAYKVSYEKHVIAEVQMLEVEQQRVEAARNLDSGRESLHSANAQVDQMSAQLQGLEWESRKTAMEKVAELEQRLSETEQEKIKADSRASLQLIRAPVAGVVQQLTAHTIGGVVSPNDKLMMLVPVDDQLEIEAMVQNKDIGFVQAGQTAAVKFDAFPFTRYGTLEGKVVSISGDAIAHEQLGLVFTTRISLAARSINIDGKTMALSAGMSTVTEIKTGRRTLMEYLLSPLLQRTQEAAQER